MISYVVKEENPSDPNELVRRCYVFQIDDLQNYDDETHMIQQVQEIFGTFQQCFKCQQDRREQLINKQIVSKQNTVRSNSKTSTMTSNNSTTMSDTVKRE